MVKKSLLRGGTIGTCSQEKCSPFYNASRNTAGERARLDGRVEESEAQSRRGEQLTRRSS